MPNHSCLCPDALDRCDRCDVLRDFPSLHLVAVRQAPTGLVLEVESCDPVTGCPGCGVIATGHGRDDRCALGRAAGADPVGDRPAPGRGSNDPGPGPAARHRLEHALVPGPARPGPGRRRSLPPGSSTSSPADPAAPTETGWTSATRRSASGSRSQRWTRSRAARTRSMTSSKTPFVRAGRLPRRQARRHCGR